MNPTRWMIVPIFLVLLLPLMACLSGDDAVFDQLDGGDGVERGILVVRWPALRCADVDRLTLDIEAYSGATQTYTLTCMEHTFVAPGLPWGAYWVRLTASRFGRRWCQQERIPVVDGLRVVSFDMECQR